MPCTWALSTEPVGNFTANTLVDLLNGAAGVLIDLDPDGKQKLAELRGKVFCLEVTVPPITLYLLPTEQGLEFRRSVEAAPDVTLTGSAPAFARLGCAASGVLSESRVTVRGDAELGQALQKILGQLDLDWEELLSRHIGDTPARKLSNAARGLAGWAEKSFDLTRENAVDYLREEKRILVTGPAMERFDQALNRTRADVDRLTRRVERLERAMAQNTQNPWSTQNPHRTQPTPPRN